jgi:uncharacterized lipoprotein YmbA
MKRTTTFYALFCLLCTGCSLFVPQADDTIFYTLGTHCSGGRSAEGRVVSKALVLNVFIDEIPQYADCPYIVTKASGQRIVHSKLARWAEPFGDACIRVVNDRLSNVVDGIIVVSSAHVVGSTVSCDHRIIIDFDDLIYNEEEGGVVVKCNWTLFSYIRGKQVLAGRYVGLVPVPENPSCDDVVMAMGDALEHVADDVAAKIQKFFIAEIQENGEAGMTESPKTTERSDRDDRAPSM